MARPGPPCPNCGRINQAHKAADGTDVPPIEGDVSICWKCHALAEFDGQGGLRKPSDERHAMLMADPDVRAALYAMTESTRPSEAVKMFGDMRSG